MYHPLSTLAVRKPQHPAHDRVCSRRDRAVRGAVGLALGICLIWPLTGAAQPECVFTLQGGRTPTCAEPVPPVQPAATQEVPPLPNQALNKPADISHVPSQPKWTLLLQDLTLYAAFSRWAKEAGWRVLWDADRHLLIDSPDVVTGDFEQAITAVVSSPGIVNGSYPLEVCFYPNTPPLVRITKRGEQAKDCK